MSESKKGKRGRKPSKCRFRSICVFGESDIGKGVEYLTAARELGNALAARKIQFVYGGGVQGLRGSAAVSASLKGSHVLSVRIKELDGQIFSVGNEIRAYNLPEQLGLMFYSAQAFIALPGGLETLDGISSIAYWAKLNFHKKPLGLLNINGFYDSLLCFLDLAVEKGFMPQATRRTIMSASNADQLIDQLQSYTFDPDAPRKQIDLESVDSNEKQKADTTLRL